MFYTQRLVSFRAHISFKYLFGFNEDDKYWCTADVGWITGHTYILYGPLSNGATSLMFEGVPTYPTASRCWEICDEHEINIFYTAPTAIRALMSLEMNLLKYLEKID